MEKEFKVEDAIVKPVEKPTEELPVEDKAETTQKELDWRDALPKEQQTNPNMLKFKTLTDLVNSYSELERKLGAGLNTINKDTPHDDMIKGLVKTFDLKEDSFKDIKEEYKSLGLKNGLHPSILKNVVDDMEAINQSRIDAKQQGYQKNLTSLSNEDEKNINAGLASLNMSYKEYQLLFKSESLNPTILNKLKGLGSKHREDGITKIKEGSSTGGLPSSSEQLRALFETKSDEILRLRDKGDFVEADKLRHDLGKIKAKYEKSRIDEARAKTTLY